MRFKISEHKAIQSLIEKAKFDPLDFTNVKKRGRLSIHHASGSSFTFFRKTSQSLDEKKQWQRVESYEIGPAKAPLAQDLDWEQVLKHFKKWLKTLPANSK